MTADPMSGLPAMRHQPLYEPQAHAGSGSTVKVKATGTATLPAVFRAWMVTSLFVTGIVGVPRIDLLAALYFSPAGNPVTVTVGRLSEVMSSGRTKGTPTMARACPGSPITGGGTCALNLNVADTARLLPGMIRLRVAAWEPSSQCKNEKPGPASAFSFAFAPGV